MRPITIENWSVVDITGTQYLNILEQELHDCYIKGEKLVAPNLYHGIITSPIKDYWHGYILTMSKHVYRLGNPNTTFTRLLHIPSRSKFDEIVTKKLNLH